METKKKEEKKDMSSLKNIITNNIHPRKTIDFIDTVLGPDQDRHIDFLTIHPRTRSTPSTIPINLEALGLLTEKYGDRVPILVSGDVFSMGSLPYTSPYLPNPREEGEEVKDAAANEGRPYLPKLRGLMSARALLANPALFDGYEACPWEAVELFMNNVVRAPLPLKLVQHHCTLLCFFLLLLFFISNSIQPNPTQPMSLPSPPLLPFFALSCSRVINHTC